MSRGQCKRWCTVLIVALQNMAFASHHVSFLTFLGHCIRGDIDAIRSILEENPEYAFELSTEGESCLHLASVYGHADITRLLLQGDDFHEFKRARETTAHPRKNRVFEGHADTAQIDSEHQDVPNDLSRSSQLPSIALDGIVKASRERPKYNDDFGRTNLEQKGVKQTNEL